MEGHICRVWVVEPARHVAKLDVGIVVYGELGVGDETVGVFVCFFYGAMNGVDSICQAFSELYFFFWPFLR